MSSMVLKKFCRKQGCNNLTITGYCESHQEEAQSYDRQRGTAASRGYNAKWRMARDRFLKANPLCVHCKREGRAFLASVVDHIVPHKGDQEKFWDVGNWQPLCKKHHDIKTATLDGGFGR